VAEYVTGVGALLGESPVWDTEAGVLWWLDIDGCSIRRYDPAADAEQSWPTPDKPGSMALCGDGRLLVSVRNGVGWLDPADGSFTPWLDLEPGEASNRMNDGKCDRVGRFWVGSMLEHITEGVFTGKLHRVDADGTHLVLRSEVGVCNGLAFSPEGDRMYFADSMRSTVWRYRYDPETGTAGDPEVFSDWSGLPGVPDGAAVDETGCYWSACASAGRRPDTRPTATSTGSWGCPGRSPGGRPSAALASTRSSSRPSARAAASPRHPASRRPAASSPSMPGWAVCRSPASPPESERRPPR